MWSVRELLRNRSAKRACIQTRRARGERLRALTAVVEGTHEGLPTRP